MEGILPPQFVEPVARTLAQRGVSDARVIGRRTGTQGSCFIIEQQPGCERVVLKTMSPLRPRNSPESVEREYHALTLFYESSRVHANIDAPEPLALFREHMGYLMGYVDAPSLEDLLKADLLDGEETRTVAHRIVRALDLYHRSVGEMYGDFHPLNVLVRPSLQVVLIDPTPTSPFQELVGNGDGYSPMSADLGYWTYCVAARSVKQILKGSKLPARLYRLTSEIVAYASRACAGDEVEGFSDALYEAAGRYVVKLKNQPRFKDKVLAPLAQSRLRVLRSRSQEIAIKRRGGWERSQPAH